MPPLLQDAQRMLLH